MWLKIKKKIKTLSVSTKAFVVCAISLSVVLVLTVLFRKKGGKFWDIYNKAIEGRDKELSIIEKKHKEQIEEAEEQIEIYKKSIERIEKEASASSKELNRSYKKRVKTLVKEHAKDPKKLNVMLSKEFGINNLD